MRSLLHKQALITGGGSGIGLAIARRLYLEGCSVTLLGRTESTLQRASQSLLLSQPLHSPAQQPSDTKRVSYHPLNVTSASSWEDLLQSNSKGGKGRVDILINCAGITQRSPLMKTSIEEVEGLLDTNLRGTVLGCKFVGRAMLRNRPSQQHPRVKADEGGAEGVMEGTEEEGKGEGKGQGVREGVQERGVIINVASLLAQKGVIGTSVYAAAKAGVVGLTTSLAHEYGRSGIRVNAVLPGYIETDMTTGLKNPSILQQIPLGRFGTTDEVADAALFLIKNPYANNCVLNLDGGLSAV
ncbi:3-oxoacyl-[acyl-carrier-protein]-reductase [Neurospora crassa OR74A]|uniref:3-oxoacyl-[acyl-carrier-protein]-reductase n=2 Tax=Neurospora crassa TaxID=5141 RepID=Q1K5E4_NEUCR|nr:3-oxoacyl-[acyl-carrier-protein]-reductase [Neurospora crassa OR74A]AAB99799.1 3-oxoacyl-[acyl-carrier-protein]-reductase [Neurospora crassa]EAA27568.3 3-oxoacyl-[acyl-carrier-protein]-reductase [Neurospora crassa OR74A]CAB98248.1 3-oxoacyl-[acyl-carrier-protein]-reductase (oar-1) [Neurospora crassa]|eukprot:XP_956804.3 3-oxoacyl-[acyl-carrier-protein]-reductase [Neurospora crassa OR74A]